MSAFPARARLLIVVTVCAVATTGLSLVAPSPASAAPTQHHRAGRRRDHPDPDLALAAPARRRQVRRPGLHLGSFGTEPTTRRRSTASTRRSCSCPTGNLYWRVRITGSGDLGGPTPTSNVARYRCDHARPVRRAAATEYPPLVSWTPVQGALAYYLQISWTLTSSIRPRSSTSTRPRPPPASARSWRCRACTTHVYALRWPRHLHRLRDPHLVHDPGLPAADRISPPTRGPSPTRSWTGSRSQEPRPTRSRWTTTSTSVRRRSTRSTSPDAVLAPEDGRERDLLRRVRPIDSAATRVPGPPATAASSPGHGPARSISSTLQTPPRSATRSSSSGSPASGPRRTRRTSPSRAATRSR